MTFLRSIFQLVNANPQKCWYVVPHLLVTHYKILFRTYRRDFRQILVLSVLFWISRTRNDTHPKSQHTDRRKQTLGWVLSDQCYPSELVFTDWIGVRMGCVGLCGANWPDMSNPQFSDSSIHEFEKDSGSRTGIPHPWSTRRALAPHRAVM